MEIGNPRNPTDFANVLAPTLPVGLGAPPDASDPWASDGEAGRVFEDALVLQLGELVPPVDVDASTSDTKANELTLDELPTTDPVVSAPGHADQLARGQTFELARLPTMGADSAEKVMGSTAHHQMLTSEAVPPLPESDGKVISAADNLNASTPNDRTQRDGTAELIDQPDSPVRSSTHRPTVQEPPSDADVTSTSAAMVSNSTPLVSEDNATTAPMKDRHPAPAGNGQLIDAQTSKSMDVIELESAYEPLDQNVPVQASAALRFPTEGKTAVENATLSEAQTSNAATFATNDVYAASDGNRPPVASVLHTSTDPAASISAHAPLNHTVPSQARETARISRIGITSVTEATLAAAQNGAEPVHAKVVANQAGVVRNQAQALAHQTDLGPTHADVAENQLDVVPDRAHVAPVHRFGATDVGEDVGTVLTSQQFSRQGSTSDLPRAVIANLGESEHPSTLPEVAGGHSMTMATTTLDLANRAHGNGSLGSTDPTRPLPQQLADHLISARREVSKGSTRIEITLDPPELGRVVIEIENTQNRLLARLIVAEPTTLQSIRAELPTLLDSLAAADVTIDEFELGQFHDAQTSSSETDGQELSDEQATFSSTPPDDSDRTDPISAATHLGVDVMA